MQCWLKSLITTWLPETYRKLYTSFSVNCSVDYLVMCFLFGAITHKTLFTKMPINLSRLVSQKYMKQNSCHGSWWMQMMKYAGTSDKDGLFLCWQYNVKTSCSFYIRFLGRTLETHERMNPPPADSKTSEKESETHLCLFIHSFLHEFMNSFTRNKNLLFLKTCIFFFFSIPDQSLYRKMGKKGLQRLVPAGCVIFYFPFSKLWACLFSRERNSW